MLSWQEERLRTSVLECEGSHCLGSVQGILRTLGRTDKDIYGICVVAKATCILNACEWQNEWLKNLWSLHAEV